MQCDTFHYEYLVVFLQECMKAVSKIMLVEIFPQGRLEPDPCWNMKTIFIMLSIIKMLWLLDSFV